MQTFLPYADFRASAATLDVPRLGKQRVETYQIILAITHQRPDGTPNEKPGHGNHPAAKMWGERHLQALWDYQVATCYEWVTVRGYRDTCLDKTWAALDRYDPALAAACLLGDGDRPWWVGDENFHRSHQSNLIRKDMDFYAPQFPGVPGTLPYQWPDLETGVLIEGRQP